MSRTKLTLAGLVVTAAIFGLVPRHALAAADAQYRHAVSPTQSQHSAPFVTDTLAPGGRVRAHSDRFITDTLAPGPAAGAHAYSGDVVGRYLITHGIVIGRSAGPVSDVANSLAVKRAVLAVSGTQGQGYRFITDTLAPGGGATSVAVPAGPGFSWDDAGIGAAGAAGIVLALLAGMRMVVSRRRTAAA